MSQKPINKLSLGNTAISFKNTNLVRMVDDYNDLNSATKKLKHQLLFQNLADIGLAIGVGIFTTNISKSLTFFKHSWSYLLAIGLIMLRIFSIMGVKQSVDSMIEKINSLGKSMWQYEPKKLKHAHIAKTYLEFKDSM